MGKNLKYFYTNELEFQHLISVRWCQMKNSVGDYVYQCAFLETIFSVKLELLGRPASNVLESLGIVRSPSVFFFS